MNRFEVEIVDKIEGAMSELVPFDSPARHTLTPDQDAHLGRVTAQHVGLVQSKFVRGQAEHGGDCHLKPGMLSHALDETADLTVYLWTCVEQLIGIADAAEARGETVTAEAIRNVVRRP